ncbi:MAG: hypothetical protein ACOZE7_04385 [Pseudomonadota bacterium]
MSQPISFEGIRSDLCRSLAIMTRLDHQAGHRSSETALGLVGPHATAWIDQVARQLLNRQLMHPDSSDAHALIEQATHAALDAGAKVIQDRLGIQSGDLAGMHFTGKVHDAARDLFTTYLLAELKSLNDTRAFAFNGQISSMFDMLLANEHDAGFVEWLLKAEIGDEFQGCRCIDSTT